MQHYLSHGGGLNSHALHLLLLERGETPHAVFVDHGADWPETYEYMDAFQDWLVSRGHRPVTVLRHGADGRKSLFDHCWEHRLVPGRKYRWCTVNFKIRPLRRFFSRPCRCDLAIDAGEAHRARPSGVRGIENRHPLVEAGTGRDACAEIIRRHGLPLPEKSGCFICPFQKKDKWLLLTERHPDLFDKAVELEKRCAQDRVRRGKPPLYIGERPLPERVARWRRAHETARRTRQSAATGHRNLHAKRKGGRPWDA